MMFAQAGKKSKRSRYPYVLVAVTSSGILKAKQKLGVTFNFDILSELKVTPSFCFAFKIPDDVTASIMYM